MCVFLPQSLVGVAGGATRAALTVHQARRDNMADISAKDGSQVLYDRELFIVEKSRVNRVITCDGEGERSRLHNTLMPTTSSILRWHITVYIMLVR